MKRRTKRKGIPTSKIEAREEIREDREWDIKVEVMSRGTKVRTNSLSRTLLEEVIAEEGVTKEAKIRVED